MLNFHNAGTAALSDWKAAVLAPAAATPQPERVTSLVHVGLVDRRNYMNRIDLSVYLPQGRAWVFSISPAVGEPRRNPANYVVKVLDFEQMQIRTVEMRSTQPLLVK